MPKGSRGFHGKCVSKAQCRLFGAIAGGKSTKASGLSSAKAGDKLRGAKIKGLPGHKRG